MQHIMKIILLKKKGQTHVHNSREKYPITSINIPPFAKPRQVLAYHQELCLWHTTELNNSLP